MYISLQVKCMSIKTQVLVVSMVNKLIVFSQLTKDFGLKSYKLKFLNKFWIKKCLPNLDILQSTEIISGRKNNVLVDKS